MAGPSRRIALLAISVALFGCEIVGGIKRRPLASERGGTGGSGGTGGLAGAGGTGAAASGAAGTTGIGGAAGTTGAGGVAGTTGLGGVAGTTGVGGAAGTKGLGGAAAGFTGRGGSAGGASGSVGSSTITLTSPSVIAGMPFPAENTCAGTDESPELNWTAGPAGTMSYAIVLFDTTNSFAYWALWNIPATVRSVPAALAADPLPAVPAGAMQASFRGSANHGYAGPCPGGQTHTYQFTLYAVNVSILSALSTGSTPMAARAAILAGSIDMGTLTGTSNASAATGGGGTTGGGVGGAAGGSTGGRSATAGVLVSENCPATRPSGTCSEDGLFCLYPTETCGCFSGVWTCASCPASQPRPGDMCPAQSVNLPNFGVYDTVSVPWSCSYGSSTCTCRRPTETWQCGVCPASHPSTGAYCGNVSLSCTYGGDACSCWGGQWSCQRPPSCPTTPNGCPPGIMATCQYPQQTCSCFDGAGISINWVCSCPADPPANGSACPGGYGCRYGDITCDCGGGWNCSARCPPERPSSGAACSSTLNCQYTGSTCACQADHWTCSGDPSDAGSGG